MRISTKAESLLVLMTVFWGATFPLLHYAVDYIAPEIIVFSRFALAACLVFPFILNSYRNTTKLVVLGGLFLGVLNCGTYLFQTIGLETIDGTRAAFITGFNVLLVPFIAPLFKLGKPRFIDIMSAVICLVGLYIITGASFSAIHRGDLWVLACAVCVALTILAVQWLTKRTHDYLLLTFYQLFFTAILSMPLLLDDQLYWHFDLSAIMVILFCAIFATVLTLFIQIRFQHYTTVIKAAIIFTLEPLFAAFFDWLINHHPIEIRTIIGGSLILASMLLPEILMAMRKNLGAHRVDSEKI